VPAYADEESVDPRRETETLAELVVEVDTPRWKWTQFVLRGGKALAERRKEVLIRFRPAHSRLPDGEPETLWIGIDGPDDLALRLVSATGDEPPATAPLVLRAPPPPAELPPYGNVLADFLGGGSRLGVRGDEAEEAWRIVEPVLEAWGAGLVPLEAYPAGAAGFSARG
jgi:glucose-6-phosphate 1-dehydrogenase